MHVVGIDPARTKHTLCRLDEDGSVDVQPRITLFAALDSLTSKPDDVRLVVVEDGPPELQDNIKALVTGLSQHRIPHVVVNTATWKKALGIPIRRTKDALGVDEGASAPKAAIKSFAREHYPKSVDFRNQHGVDALCIAHYGKHVVLAPRPRMRKRRADFTLQLEEPLLWRFWPQYHQSGAPRLYVELLRQCSPDEPFLGRHPTAANAGISTGRFWTEVDSLAQGGLLARDGTAITLYGMDTRLAEIVPADEPQESLQQMPFESLLSDLTTTFKKARPGQQLPTFTARELASLKDLSDTTQHRSVVTYYRLLLRLQADSNAFHFDDDNDLEVDWRVRTRKAVDRLRQELESESSFVNVLVSHAKELRTVEATLARRRVDSHQRRELALWEAELAKKRRRGEIGEYHERPHPRVFTDRMG